MAGLLLLVHKTINWLNVQNVWKCADDPRIVVDRFHLIILFLNISILFCVFRRLDVLVTAFSTILLVLIIVFFYGGSYIQTENAQRNLVQCKFMVVFICDHAKIKIMYYFA